jgi:hypothetical protein
VFKAIAKMSRKDYVSFGIFRTFAGIGSDLQQNNISLMLSVYVASAFP